MRQVTELAQVSRLRLMQERPRSHRACLVGRCVVEWMMAKVYAVGMRGFAMPPGTCQNGPSQRCSLSAASRAAVNVWAGASKLCNSLAKTPDCTSGSCLWGCRGFGDHPAVCKNLSPMRVALCFSCCTSPASSTVLTPSWGPLSGFPCVGLVCVDSVTAR